MKHVKFEVREALPSDLALVHSVLFLNLRRNSRASDSVVDRYLDDYVDEIIRRSLVRVAYFAETPDEILSFAVTEADACHMLYTKSPYRGYGIGTSLVRDTCRYYTQWLGERAREYAHSRGMQYNPYLVIHRGKNENLEHLFQQASEDSR